MSIRFKRDFSSFCFDHNQISHEVWTGGSGSPVILMHELDGFGQAFVGLAERLAEEFLVYAPLFFGRVGEKPFSGGAKGTWHICVRREFAAFSCGKTSPVADWVRGLARQIHAQHLPAKVGVVGMCLTGGLVLATVAEPAVATAVAAQPSLPLTVGLFGSRKRRQDLGMSAEDIQAAVQAAKPILTLRFGQDDICPAERVAAISATFPTSHGPPEYLQNTKSHPTLTARYRDGMSEEVRAKSFHAIAETIRFLHQHLD